MLDKSCKGKDSQEHYFSCPFMNENSKENNTENFEYSDIFGKNQEKKHIEESNERFSRTLFFMSIYE